MKKNFYTRLINRGYNKLFLNEIFSQSFHRDQLLQKLSQLFKESSQTSTQKNIKVPSLFKVMYSPQAKLLRIKDCIRTTDLVKQSHLYNAFNLKEPIICYSNPPSTFRYFSTSRKTLHNSLDKYLDIANSSCITASSTNIPISSVDQPEENPSSSSFTGIRDFEVP